LRGLYNAHPETGLILLGDRYNCNKVIRALRMGARGLFCRVNSSFRALCRCISVVHQGQFWLDTEQISYVIDAITTPQPTRLISWDGKCLLSPREEQVVSLVAEALGNRDIAQQLKIKENTIKKSLLRIYDKLGVSNRVELVLYALAHRSTERTSPLCQSR
ncbi:MAG TPA: response regulator transcription factor, partial [Candidatus Bathyarchaeia archaeon]|nr:response regulator transcription factor [Candidatus Bathyarchaeia archaeon]